MQPPARELAADWGLAVIPTRDNRWGEFRWPPSGEVIGPEVRSLRWCEETTTPGEEQRWHEPGFDDSRWATCRAGIGPYWLYTQPDEGDGGATQAVLRASERVEPGARIPSGEAVLDWKTVEFSKTIGLARPAPWGGHSGYPDGAIDQNFIDLPAGRKLLFTRMHSPAARRLGLRVELRNSAARLWVNGVEQPFEGALGNLPLQAGVNSVLLDLPDGGKGRLYAQAQPPAVSSMEDAARGVVTPDLRQGAWIWGGNTTAGYVRRQLRLDEAPAEARVVVTAYTGYRLYVNGVKVEEEIGPWANWRRPETFDVARHLHPGENVVALWGQVHADLGVVEQRGLVAVLKMRFPNGQEQTLATDARWRGSGIEEPGWSARGFDDSRWQAATVIGRMGVPPWGDEPLKNVGAVTEPHRQLAIDLPSPYLECFDEVGDLAYDVKTPADPRVGWYRCAAPPGLRRLHLRTTAPARVWVDGIEARVAEGIAFVEEPPVGVSQVAIRLRMRPGAYGGAAFELPLGLELEGGEIQTGEWGEFALPTYSGIGVYRQRLDLTAAEAERSAWLDLGQVLVAAEVLVNDRPAGVRLARPFRFDLTGLLRAGGNTIEVRVANTIAPHYTVTNQVANLGPTASGLIGPVRLALELEGEEWSTWAASEVERLERELRTSTPELQAAQRAWEKSAGWSELGPHAARTAGGESVPIDEDGCVSLSGRGAARRTYSVVADTGSELLTGMRLELLPPPGGGSVGDLSLLELGVTVAPAGDEPLRARFVRIEIPDRGEYLSLAEVQVFDGQENIAPSGAARQSGTSAGGEARLAIDGNTDGDYFGSHSVTHTPPHHAPWWELDLGATRGLERIVLWNRTDGGLETRLRDFVVSVLDEERRPVWRRRIARPPSPSLALDLLGPVALKLRATDTPLPVERTGAAHIVDGRFDTGWGTASSETERQALVFEAVPPVGFASGATLTFELTWSGPASGEAGPRLRFSTTRAPGPLVDIPARIEGILAIERTRRSAAQRAELAAFHRSFAPETRPVRDRLGRLREELTPAVDRSSDR